MRRTYNGSVHLHAVQLGRDTADSQSRPRGRKERIASPLAFTTKCASLANEPGHVNSTPIADRLGCAGGLFASGRAPEEERIPTVQGSARSWRAGLPPICHHKYLQCGLRLLRVRPFEVRSESAP